MPNIAEALKAEIARITRKDLRASIDPMKQALARIKREISALQQHVQALDRQASRVSSTTAKRVAESVEPNTALRFSAAGLKKHRERLGLSAAQAAKLLGCSALSVYKWESGQVRPRQSQLPAIAQLRALGKRDALKQLEALG